MKWDGADIARITDGELYGEAGARGPILTDSRSDLAGAWFLALRGERFDGHRFATQAREAGALGGIFEREVEGWSGPWVQVDSTFQALQALGAAARDRVNGPVVGISGCTGKTTTRELVACALAPLGSVHRNRANDNNHVGVPLTLLACPEEASALVVELGSSAPGEMAPLVRLTRPDIRLCLNIGPAHLEALGDLAAVRREEGWLVDQAGPADVVVVPSGDPWLQDLEVSARTLRFGCEEAADVRLVRAVASLEDWTTEIECEVEGRRVRWTLPVPGAHLGLNAAAALAVAWAAGVEPASAARGMEGYVPVGRRLHQVVLPSGTRVVDDSYNANPVSVRAALALMGGSAARTAVVLGDMLELGSEEGRYHREVLEYAKSLGFGTLVVLGPRMTDAARGMTGVDVATDPQDAARRVRGGQEAPDWVLLKASRGMRLERVLQALRAEEGER